MTPKQIDTALQKLNLVLEDLQMLRDRTWNLDTNFWEATIDNLNEVINIIENE